MSHYSSEVWILLPTKLDVMNEDFYHQDIFDNLKRKLKIICVRKNFLEVRITQCSVWYLSSVHRFPWISLLINCWWLINPFEGFFGIEGHVALDRNSGPGYNTLLLRLISGDLYSECHHIHFHKLPNLLHNRVALPIKLLP